MNRFILLFAVVLFAQPTTAAAETKAAQTDFNITLEEAYKKEFAFLVSQERQLQNRLGSMDAQNDADRMRLQNEVAGLENQVLAIDAQLQEARRMLMEVERSTDSSTEDQRLILATLEQASTSLKDSGIDITIPEDESLWAQKAVEVFGAAAKTLSDFSTLRRHEGQDFFLADGRKVMGTIIHVGRIAAYGVSPQGSGVLAPAGGGKLKVWKDADAPVAEALAMGQSPHALSIFLFESIDAAVEDDAEQSAFEHVAAGGAIAWVIMALGALALFLGFARAMILLTCKGSTEVLEEGLGAVARQGDVEAVITKAQAAKGSAARVVASVFRSIREGTDRFDEAISEGLIAEGRRVQLFSTMILVIAAVAPLLGLLGTVTGMISTFDVITKFGTGDPKMLSGGISTALITTELGLIVAIPALLLGNLLKGWADRIEAEAERAAIRMVTLYTGRREVSLAGHERPGLTTSAPEVRIKGAKGAAIDPKDAAAFAALRTKSSLGTSPSPTE